jgi:hypothetical protein
MIVSKDTGPNGQDPGFDAARCTYVDADYGGKDLFPCRRWAQKSKTYFCGLYLFLPNTADTQLTVDVAAAGLMPSGFAC